VKKATTQRPTAATDARARWRRIALSLVVATMAYNLVEAGIAISAGIAARSIALVGFGLDSVVELAAAGALLWRLSVEERGADPESVERAERRVGRFIGVTFLALALYVTVQSAVILIGESQPQESLIGIVLAGASLLVMPLIAWGKLRAAAAIGSGSLRAEARETLACAYLSFALMVGLAANAAFGWWWADPVAALLMVPWLANEGIEGLRGEEE